MSSGTSRRGPYRKDKMRYEPQCAVNTGGAFAGGRGRGHGDEQRQRPVAIDDERWHQDGRQQRVVFFRWLACRAATATSPRWKNHAANRLVPWCLTRTLLWPLEGRNDDGRQFTDKGWSMRGLWICAVHTANIARAVTHKMEVYHRRMKDRPAAAAAQLREARDMEPSRVENKTKTVASCKIR